MAGDGHALILAYDMMNAKLPGVWGAWQGGTCVVVGDDHALMAETGALARKAIGCRLFAARPFDRPSGHLQHDFNESPVRSRCAATHHLMADIELLAHTDFFVGTGSTG